jgi:hypothetical protein
MSKGSLPRPYSVDLKTFNNNWDNIFRKDPRIIEDQQIEDEAFESIASQSEVKDSNQGG